VVELAQYHIEHRSISIFYAPDLLHDAGPAAFGRALEHHDDLDADEADDLRPAMEQAQARTGDLAAEKEQLDAQAAALARIVAEQQGLLTEATTYLQKLRDKSAALAEDYRRLMGHDPVSVR
jgi:ABC-type transporter Mla subunit MlaD